MPNDEARQNPPPEPDAGEQPEMTHYDSTPGQEAPLPPPPAPDTETPAPGPMHRRRVRAHRQRSGHEDDIDLMSDEDFKRVESQVYSALVWAALRGAIDPESLAEGKRPWPRAILRHAGKSVQEGDNTDFRKVVYRSSTEVFMSAYRRAQEFIVPPVMPWPPKPKPQDKKQNSYERLMSILSTLSERENLPQQPYFSWGQGVRAFYHGPLALKGARPYGASWGLNYTDDLAHYPSTLNKRLQTSERHLLEGSFVRLDGVPHLDEPDDLLEIARGLPKDTPVLCITDESEAVALRAHPNLDPHRVRPHRMEPSGIALMNLILLHNLRTAGKPTFGALLSKLTRYPEKKLQLNLHDLHKTFGAGAGVLLRSKHNEDVYETYFEIADTALILDARPRLPASEASESSEKSEET